MCCTKDPTDLPGLSCGIAMQPALPTLRVAGRSRRASHLHLHWPSVAEAKSIGTSREFMRAASSQRRAALCRGRAQGCAPSVHLIAARAHTTVAARGVGKLDGRIVLHACRSMVDDTSPYHTLACPASNCWALQIDPGHTANGGLSIDVLNVMVGQPNCRLILYDRICTFVYSLYYYYCSGWYPTSARPALSASSALSMSSRVGSVWTNVSMQCGEMRNVHIRH
jgi:hypothetical protein